MRAGIIDSEVNDIWQVAHDSGTDIDGDSSYTITGLDGNADIEYRLITYYVQSIDSLLTLTFNSDTGANYGTQYIFGTNTTPSSLRYTGHPNLRVNQSVSGSSGTICFGDTHIFAKSGEIRTALNINAGSISGTTVPRITKNGFVWNNSADNITQMVLAASSGTMLSGTRLILLKKVHNDGMKTGTLTPNKIKGAWERIYDSTLSSAATSVTISDLEGDTDCLYRLVTRGISGYAGSAFIQIQPNADATTSNYGYQSLRGDSTTASAARATTYDGILCGYSTAITRLFFSDVLLYAKSGYERTALSNIVNNITGTTVLQINLTGGVWDNTADEITSLRLISSQADGLGIGTHLELYRLNL